MVIIHHTVLNKFVVLLLNNAPNLVLLFFHNNVRSIRRNLENLVTHYLQEFDLHFSLIGLTETKITISNEEGTSNLAQIPGYAFEYVPTPLSSGGVGLFIDTTFHYRVLERITNEAFQALWIETLFEKQKNITCGVIYC